MRAPWGERRSLESMVFVDKLPDWEGLRCAVIRCAEGVQDGVWGHMGWVLGVSVRLRECDVDVKDA